MGAKQKKKRAFSHGAFWDSYSQSWEHRYEGCGFAKQGEVLGAEWGDDAAAEHILKAFILPHVTRDSVVLEIGPGGGKYSRHLCRSCRELVLADVSREMLGRARKVCGENTREVLLDGISLEGIPDKSVDLVVSIDVFVHLESEEIFRYLAEINRVLKSGGSFVVNVQGFESCYGALAYFRQIRDHLTLLGERFGGRLYPLSFSMLQMLGWHSGFELAQAEHNWQDSLMTAVLRRAGPAWPWKILTTPALLERYELAARLGGSGQRQLFTGVLRGENRVAALMLMEAGQGAPWKRPVSWPERACVPAPLALEQEAGLDVVIYPPVPGVGCVNLCDKNSPFLRGERIPTGILHEFVRDMLFLLGQGVVNPDFGPPFLVLDVHHEHLVGLGFSLADRFGMAPEEARRKTVEGLWEALTSLARAGRLTDEVEHALLEQEPSSADEKQTLLSAWVERRSREQV